MAEFDPDFEKRLDAALERNHLDKKNGIVSEKTDEDNSGWAYGMRMGMEFVSGTIVGLGIGWGADRLFDTLPLFLIIGLLLGFAAGMMNVYRAINNIPEGIGINRQNSLTKEANKPTSNSTD